jgi:hypothetical protein
MPKRASRRRTSAKSDQRPTGREVIGFIEKFLRIPDGPYAGQPLILAPWQKQEIHRIYNQPVRRAVISTAGNSSASIIRSTVRLLAKWGTSA